ncbi:MAG: sigma-54-dependent Fis family transcriptional regulator [Candidatus Aminicenantes bacterium]|nr:sigma-54-dependent Fis family transcriptional regulator [Candidatus Aminicenantes bacterium]
MDTSVSLLILSESDRLYESLRLTPAASGYHFFYCRRSEEALKLIEDNGLRAAVLEIGSEVEKNRRFLIELLAFEPLLQVIIAGPRTPPEEVMEWIRAGAVDYIEAPVGKESILAALRRLLDKQDLRRETYLLEKRLEKKYQFQSIVSKNPYMFEIFGLVESIAKHFTSVLVTGETGTGKELIARAIHALSETKNRRFVVCDCAAIPENLFESELFGYVRGAFTGADRNKRGLFEEAQEGVVFLDEIGEIPLPVQAKLLRVLENRQFRPLGSNEVRYLQVRVIAATNRNITEAVRRNAFREDLYHRLNRVEIRVPPLRERLEDIPLLVRHFLEQIGRAYGKTLKGVTRDVQKLFQRYHWPGNVRELENALQSAAMVTKKDFLDLADLPKNLREATPRRRRGPFPEGESLSTLEDLEKDYIAFVLNQTAHNLKRTAETLGVSRTTLYNKLARYGLRRD